MSSIVEISAATVSVVCDANGAAQHVVNVHNISGRKLRVGARAVVDGETKAQWIGPIAVQGKEGQQEWDLDADQTIQLTIPITANDAAQGKYTFRIEVYSTDAPSEDFTTGDGIAFEVAEPKPVSTPTAKPFPWAIVIAAVIVALLVLGGGGWAIYNAKTKTRVPDLSDLLLDDAKKMIVANELAVGEVTSKHEGDKPKNTVIDQTPDADEKVKKGETVNLVIESGTATVTPPRVHKQGRFNIRQTFLADLDAGVEGSNGADFWFEAVTATERFLVPRNGSKLVRMGNRTLSYGDCLRANFGTARIPLQTLPAGTTLCARTNEGRISAFRVENNVGPSPGVLTISFTTWEKRIQIMPISPRTLHIIN